MNSSFKIDNILNIVISVILINFKFHILLIKFVYKIS